MIWPLLRVNYTISSLGGSDGQASAAGQNDASAIARAVSGIGATDVLAVGQTFTVDVDASVPEMAHLNSLTQGMTFIKVSDTLIDIDGPNKDAEFNLAQLPSDSVVARGMGAASETGRSGASGLEADKRISSGRLYRPKLTTQVVKVPKRVMFWLHRLLFIAKMVETQQKRQVL